jgi:hypothetical protein
VSFSYDTSLPANRDRVRILISDTVSTSAIYSDEELDGLLDLAGNVYQAASVALRARAASFVGKTIKYNIGAEIRGALSLDRTKVIQEILRLADSYEDKAVGINQAADEFMDRAAFCVDAFGRDVSEYQGVDGIGAPFSE